MLGTHYFMGKVACPLDFMLALTSTITSLEIEQALYAYL